VAAINKTSIQSRGHLFSTNRLVFSISKYFIINDVGHTAEQHSHGRPPGRNYGPVERGVNRQSSAPNGQISAPVGQTSAPHGAVNPQPPLFFVGQLFQRFFSSIGLPEPIPPLLAPFAMEVARPAFPPLSPEALEKLTAVRQDTLSAQEFLFHKHIPSSLCPVPGCGFHHQNDPGALNRHHYQHHPNLALVFKHWKPPASIDVCFCCNCFVPPNKSCGKKSHQCPTRLNARVAGPRRIPLLVVFKKTHFDYLRNAPHYERHQPVNPKSQKLCPVLGCTFKHNGHANTLNRHIRDVHPNLDLSSLPVSTRFNARLQACCGCNTFAPSKSTHVCDSRRREETVPAIFFNRPEDRAVLGLDLAGISLADAPKLQQKP